MIQFLRRWLEEKEEKQELEEKLRTNKSKN
jgi:hypothetical protein